MRHGLVTPFIGLCAVTALAACEVKPGPPPPAEIEHVDEVTPVPDLSSAPVAPIVGGGLIVTRDDRFVIAADLDRDMLWIVDPNTRSAHGRLPLQAGDRPNRMAEDAAGRVHVALRRGGAVVAFDPVEPAILRRTAVCPAPRGIAYDIGRDSLYVACLHGALVELDAETHAERRRVMVAPDLRDVVVDGDRVLVNTFRSAEVFAVDGAGAIEPVPAAVESHRGGEPLAPRVAWRMVPDPTGDPVLLHQRHRRSALPDLSSAVQYYAGGGGCGSAGVLHQAVSRVGPGAQTAEPALPVGTVLGVDVAVSPDGRVAVADPNGTPGLYEDLCGELGVAARGVVAVAWQGTRLWWFEPQTAQIAGERPSLSSGSTERWLGITFDAAPLVDSGHALFHRATRSGIACASCHPEGGEDGHVWVFEAFGPRRTQTLHGGLSGRAPFHWSGDLDDFDTFMEEVFVGRMGGDPLTLAEHDALGAWLDTVPTLPPAPALDPGAVERGERVFDEAGCRACHFADGTVDPGSHDVGTGEALQVPSLVGAAHRLPLMHDGCAGTLAERFVPACGGAAHGDVEALPADARADLVAFLESL